MLACKWASCTRLFGRLFCMAYWLFYVIYSVSVSRLSTCSTAPFTVISVHLFQLYNYHICVKQFTFIGSLYCGSAFKSTPFNSSNFFLFFLFHFTAETSRLRWRCKSNFHLATRRSSSSSCLLHHSIRLSQVHATYIYIYRWSAAASCMYVFLSCLPPRNENATDKSMTAGRTKTFSAEIADEWNVKKAI